MNVIQYLCPLRAGVSRGLAHAAAMLTAGEATCLS